MTMSQTVLALSTGALLALSTNASPNPHDHYTDQSYYTSYIAQFGKQYQTLDEFRVRMEIFSQTQELIRKHNAHTPRHSFYLGHNQFSDMTLGEKSAFFGYRHHEIYGSATTQADQHYTILEENFDNMKDWREEGAVGEVRNEYPTPHACEACWAFAVTATLEAAHFIKSGELLEFSPQQLVDCDPGSIGCQGGEVDTAVDYFKTAPIMLDSDYPYVAKDGKCQTNPAKSTGIYVTERFNVKPNDVGQLKAAVALQPVAAAVQGYEDVFMQYKTGIFESPQCGTALDHAVVLVGFGTDAQSSEEYWILRNDWGTQWGEQGYMRLKMQDGAGVCGVNMAPTYASVSK